MIKNPKITYLSSEKNQYISCLKLSANEKYLIGFQDVIDAGKNYFDLNIEMVKIWNLETLCLTYRESLDLEDEDNAKEDPLKLM